MAPDRSEALALWRYHLIAEALSPRLGSRERGLIVRRIAGEEHAGPDGEPRVVGRNTLDRWIRAGWVDSFRRFQPAGGHYSWWSQRFGVRAKNIGWRIDYVLTSPNVAPFLEDAWITPHVAGSDHCPCGVDLDPAVVG